MAGYQSRIVDRVLFGRDTCRTGCCGKDGRVCVAIPAFTAAGVFSKFVRIWYCEEHAQEAVEPKKKELPFGWSCIVAYRPYGKTEYVEKEIHRRGKTAGCVRSAAKKMNSYKSHREVTPYTKEQWIRMFGVGSETGRYAID